MNSITELIDELRAGRMVILVDDENRENEGDLILAADFVTPQAINFMACEARGLICLSLTQAQIKNLGLPLMVRDDVNHSPNKTAFTVSIEAATGVSTGISAADRAHTIRVAANPIAKKTDIITPGHIFPIQAQEGGVLRRAGHTEASVDLARLAGLNPAAVICEIMNPDGSMARVDDLKTFAAKHGIKIGTIEDLIKYRLETESFVEERVNTAFNSLFGQNLQARVFVNKLDGRKHIAIIKGDLNPEEPTLVRVHAEDVLSDVFATHASKSRMNLQAALSAMDAIGRGVLLYLRIEDLEARLLGHKHMDDRDYGVGAQILHSLGLKKIILVSNNPTKRVGIKGYGIEIVDTIQVAGVEEETHREDEANKEDKSGKGKNETDASV